MLVMAAVAVVVVVVVVAELFVEVSSIRVVKATLVLHPYNKAHIGCRQSTSLQDANISIVHVILLFVLCAFFLKMHRQRKI